MNLVSRLALVIGLAMPGMALAAGTEGGSEPDKTKTSTECTKSQVWDEETKTCVDAQSGQLDNDTLFDAARELAYVGRPDDALVVLSAMTEGASDRVLTYKGFASRKAGDMDAAMGYYQAALSQNPDNLLARSYMGQAFVEDGEITLAQAQLDEIVLRGGSGGWPERSLRHAIETGATYSY